MPSLPQDPNPVPEQEPLELLDIFKEEILRTYSRAQALQKGLLMDVTETAKEAGFPHPVALTSALWADLQAIPEGFEGQDFEGRLRQVLILAEKACQQSNAETFTLTYPVFLPVIGEEVSDYPVKLVFHAGDSGEPVYTLGRPTED